MTRPEIIELAKKSGFFFQTFEEHAPIQHTRELPYSERCFERFAAAVEAATIDRCYKAVDGVMVTDHSANTFQRCLKDIRSLK